MKLIIEIDLDKLDNDKELGFLLSSFVNGYRHPLAPVQWDLHRFNYQTCGSVRITE